MMMKQLLQSISVIFHEFILLIDFSFLHIHMLNYHISFRLPFFIRLKLFEYSISLASPPPLSSSLPPVLFFKWNAIRARSKLITYRITFDVCWINGPKQQPYSYIERLLLVCLSISRVWPQSYLLWSADLILYFGSFMKFSFFFSLHLHLLFVLCFEDINFNILSTSVWLAIKCALNCRCSLFINSLPPFKPSTILSLLLYWQLDIFFPSSSNVQCAMNRVTLMLPKNVYTIESRKT